MASLGQLKSEAKKKYNAKVGFVASIMMSSTELDTLITTVYNAGLERAVEVVEKDREMIRCYEGCKCRRRITTQLQAEVNKDRK